MTTPPVCQWAPLKSLEELSDTGGPCWPGAHRAAFLSIFSMESRMMIGSQMVEQYSNWDLALIWAATKIMPDITQPLVGLTDDSGNLLGSDQVVCEGKPMYIARDTNCKIWSFSW